MKSFIDYVYALNNVIVFVIIVSGLSHNTGASRKL